MKTYSDYTRTFAASEKAHELETLQVALNNAKQRAEDAESDLDEAKKELREELAEQTDRANELEVENQEYRAKIEELENAAAIEGHKLTDAYRQIEALKKYNAAQKQVIADMEKMIPLEDAAIIRLDERKQALESPRTKPGINAIPGPDPSDTDPHLQEKPVQPAPRKPVSVRQLYNVKTRTWQPA